MANHMANYIHQLQDRTEELAAQLEAARDGLSDLERYIQSPKFSSGDRLDSYVNTGDVARYISSIRAAILDAEVNTRNEKYQERLRQEQERRAAAAA